MKPSMQQRPAATGGSSSKQLRRQPAKAKAPAAQVGNRHMLRLGAGAGKSVERTLRSAGQPLESATRAAMEADLGADFSDVRVHTGTQAAQSADAVNANAYTAGRDVVFGPGRYAPQTGAGRELIAHELTHVIQQGDSPQPRTIQRDEKDQGPAPPPTQPAQADAPAAAPAPSAGVAMPNAIGTIPFEGTRVKDMKALNSLMQTIRGILDKQKSMTFTVTSYYDVPEGDAAKGDEQQIAQQQADGLVIMCNVNANIPKNIFKTGTMSVQMFDAASRPMVGVAVVPDQPIAGVPGSGPVNPNVDSGIVIGVTGIQCGKVETTLAPRKCPEDQPDPFKPLPPVIIPPEHSIAGLLLKAAAPDIAKIIEGPVSLAQKVVSKIDPDVDLMKEIKKALTTMDEPDTKPPLTNQGIFADDPSNPDFARRQADMQGDVFKNLLKAFLFTVPGQAGVPQPPFDPVGTTFFIRLPAMKFPGDPDVSDKK